MSDVIERVKKLLAMAKDASSPQEASIAAAKAQELIAKHKIDEKLLTTEEDVVVESDAYSMHPQEWQRDLAFSISRGMFCKAVHTPRGKKTGGRSWIHWVGRPEDIAAARALFNYLRRELKKMAAEEFWTSHEKKAKLPRGSVEWKKHFYNGAVFMIDDRLEEGRRGLEAREETRGLVLASDGAVEAKIGSLFEKTKTSTSELPSRPTEAWLAGVHAARKIDLKRSAQ